MRIDYLQDMDIFAQGGGAQLTDKAHFIKGLQRGYDLLLDMPSARIDVKSKDPVLISNAVSFPIDLFKEMVVNKRPMIWFFHDYFPICKYRLFYPMRETCKECYLKERWLPILASAKLLIWLSPLHRDSFLWLYPELETIPYHISPSPVDGSTFCDLGLPRVGTLNIEGLHPFKGRKNILQWAKDNPEEKLTCVGGNPDPNEALPSNVSVMGGLDYREMNFLMNQFRNFVHLPQSPSPFDRAPVEAYLAGCELIMNGLVGCTSFPWFTSREEVREHCMRSPDRFWDAIDKALK